MNDILTEEDEEDEKMFDFDFVVVLKNRLVCLERKNRVVVGDVLNVTLKLLRDLNKYP